MTAPWSPRDERADQNDSAPRTRDRARTTPRARTPLARARTVMAAWPARRTAVVSSAVALTLVGGLAVAATVQTTQSADVSALTALGLEIEAPATAPTVVVPEDAVWTLDPTDAKASVDKADVPTIREARAASRAAERRALDEAADAEAQAAAAAAPRAAESSAAAQVQPQAQAPAVTAAEGSERGTLAAMLNDYRARSGVHTLARDAHLDQVAQAWASWMASNQVLQHNPSYRSEAGPGWSSVGENIVRHTGGASMSTSAVVSWMFGWWQNSSVHRENMLNARYTHVGIGYVMGPGGPYAVQLFGGR